MFIAGEWQPVTVSGIAISAEYLWPARSRQDILTPPDDFGVIFVAESLGSRLDLAPQALVRLDSGGSSQDLEHLRDLATDAGATDVYGRAQQPSNAALQEDVSGFGELAWMFPALFLTAAGLTTYILLSRLVQSQRANIGMFLANGMPARTVLVHYLGYGLVPAFVAGMAGAVGGTLLGGALTHLYTDALSIPLTVTHINPLASSVGVGVAILAGTAATILPAWSQPGGTSHRDARRIASSEGPARLGGTAHPGCPTAAASGQAGAPEHRAGEVALADHHSRGDARAHTDHRLLGDDRLGALRRPSRVR